MKSELVPSYLKALVFSLNDTKVSYMKETPQEILLETYNNTGWVKAHVEPSIIKLLAGHVKLSSEEVKDMSFVEASMIISALNSQLL